MKKCTLFALLLVSAWVWPAAADWRDEQWSDMETGEMVGTDRANDPKSPQATIPFVVNATCSETSDRRQMSCYFIRLSFLVESATKACNADAMVYRETLTPIERSASRVVWLATGKPSLLTGEVITHRLQVTFNLNAPRLFGRPYQSDRWEYRTETFYPKQKTLNSVASASNSGQSAWRVPFAAPCRPTAVGIMPFTSGRGAMIPE